MKQVHSKKGAPAVEATASNTPYRVPAKEVRAEIKVSNSTFIATAGPAFSVAEAKAFITRIRAEFADATHNVPLFLVGHGTSVISHSSDDGEPSGTAGRPALAVLQGSGLGDIAVVVTRYFGGTKLGTGGLVRAYSDAVRAVLAVMPTAERRMVHIVRLELPYSALTQVRRFVEATHGQIAQETFAGQVTIVARFPVEYFALFQQAIRNLSSGLWQAEIVQTKFDLFTE